MSYTFESSVSTAGWWQLANKLGRNGRKRWEANAQGSLDDTLEMLSNEHNDAMTTACDICSSEKRFKKACRGGLQNAWLTNSAHYPVCSLLTVMWTGIGAKGSVRPPKTSRRGSGEAPTNSVPRGKARREQPAHVTVTKRHELCHAVLAGTEIGGHLPGRRGGLPWLGMVQGANGAGLVACSSTSHFSGLICLH